MNADSSGLQKRESLFRLCLFTGAITYGLWWVISIFGNHNRWDPLYLRLLISFTMISFGFLSYVVPFIKKNLEYLCFGSAVLILGHYFILMAKNDVSVNVGSGLYIVITISAFCLQRLSLMLLYDFLGIVFVYFTFTNVENPTLKPFQVLFGFISIMIASHTTMLIRLKLEKNLENEAKNFQNLFNSTFEGLALVINGHIFKTNRPFDQVFQVPTLNKPLSEFINLQPAIDFRTEGFKGSERSQMLLKVKKKNLILDGVHSELYSVIDITSEVENEVQLANTNKLASLGELSSGIAHEINNPLAIILSSTELLKEFAEQPHFDRTEILNHASLIQKTVERVSKIMLGLRHFSRDASMDDYQWVTVNDLVEEVLSFCKSALKNQAIEVEVHLQNLSIYCQQVQIEQVLLNLITNAIHELEQVPAGKRLLRIHAFESSDVVVFQIEDSGRGIPKTMQQKLFQPFFTTKPRGKGTGLGLSISKGIIDSHGGKIYLDSEAPTTRFVIQLPQTQKKPAAI